MSPEILMCESGKAQQGVAGRGDDRWEMPIHFGVPEPVQNDLGPLTRGCFGGGNLGQAKFGSIQIAPNPNLAKFEQLAHP